MKRARVLLADDHRLVAEGLKRLLDDEFELVGIVEDGMALLAAAKKLRPDVIVADITMPKLNGIEALARLKKSDPEVKVVFLTMHQDASYARRALEAGAAGFLIKHSASAALVARRPAAVSASSLSSRLRSVPIGSIFWSTSPATPGTTASTSLREGPPQSR